MNQNKSDLRVLQILPTLEMGGVERGTIDLAIYLKEQGYFSLVVSSGGRLVFFLEKNQVDHQRLSVESKNIFMMLINVFRLIKIIKKYNINIIHARGRAPAWSAYLAAKFTKISFVTTFHGIYSYNNRLKKFYNSVMTKGVKIIAISNFIARHIIKEYYINSEKIKIIHRGVDFQVFNPELVTSNRISTLIENLKIPVDKYIIFLPGRLTRWKGHEVLLEALSNLNRKDYICVMIGKSKNRAYVQELENKATRYGFRDRLHIMEECKDMGALYKLSTVVVCPSTRPEPFGRTAAEAGAMGCPVISSAQGGSLEIVVPGKTGWFFPVHDSKALAKLIDQALNLSLEEREKMKNAAISHIQNKFDNRQMCLETISVYKNILNSVLVQNPCQKK